MLLAHYPWAQHLLELCSGFSDRYKQATCSVELMLTEVANALWRLQQRLTSAMNLVDHIEPNRTLFIYSQGSHVANCKPPIVYKHLIKSSNSLRSKLYISLQK